MQEKIGHVAPKEQCFRRYSQYREGRFEDEVVLHLCEVGSDFSEKVVVLHELKCAFDHRVLKVNRAIVGGDLTRQVLLNA